MKINYSINVKMNYLLKSFPSYEDNVLTPKYIIIHDTAGQSSSLNEAKRLQSQSEYSKGIAHYYVDDNEAYQLVYDDVKAWHAGDGVYAKGNGESIGIEVCKSLPSGGFTSENQKEIYKKALDNAYKLASDLCKAYKINPNNILQHRECSATACPYTQKVLYGSYDTAKKEAIHKVNKYYKSKANTTSASDFKYQITSDRVYKSTKNMLGYVDEDLGYLEKNDRFNGYFVSNGLSDGLDWYKVVRVKNFNNGAEYDVNPYYITKQSYDYVDKEKDGYNNFKKI